MKQIINTPNAPAPIGPYNQAVLAGDTLYISGQIALSPTTGAMQQTSIKDETHAVMQNLHAILQAAGLDWIDVVKCSIFLTDMQQFSSVNEVYATYFTKGAPARETVEVAALPKGARVEISCIATKSGW